MRTNVLYYGDNLPILRSREYFSDGSVDLIYLDPPFNSKADYNVLFKEASGESSQAQIRAFSDFWHWDEAAAGTYQELITEGPLNVSKTIGALHELIGENDVTAYLVMMAARLIEMKRIMKSTGSIYLHCDSTASHYLKVVMDTIFGPKNFRNEITWKRFNFHADARRFGRVTDTLLFYTRSEEYTWNPVFGEHRKEYLASHFTSGDNGRMYSLDNPVAKGQGPPRRFGDKVLEPPVGTHWRWDQEAIDKMVADGRIVFTRTGRPRVKRYLDEMRPPAIHCLWTDIPSINSQAKERLGYETQKPLALLERIIQASSNPGDIVLDPFCGCGTAVVAAQKLERQWVGIDITHLAIAVMRKRLKDSFPGLEFAVVGEPVDLDGAKALARQNQYQFQYWATGLIGAQPLGDERKKGADKGIDGVITFMDAAGKPARAIISVKSGHVNSGQVRDLKGVMEREKAAMGLFITLEPPTRDMNAEALGAGFHHSELWQRDCRRVQILTVDDLLHGKGPDLPGRLSPYAQAQRIGKEGQQGTLEGM
ncbi:MAG: restriction endonuclease [Chloroflexi bacterium]|nr:restriction endonuclease [Chloroflexota bacterium]